MRRPVDVIVPDAGPLITLAAAERLDLLQCFDRPVRVLDVVREECLRDPGMLAYDEIKRWFDAPGRHKPDIVATPLIGTYLAVRRDEENLDAPGLQRGVGDAGLAWLVKNLPTLLTPGSTTLVMTEDANLGDTRLDARAHVLSTRAFLKGLENIGAIGSAAAVIETVQTRGRNPSRYLQDRRGKDASGDTTDWIAQAQSFLELKSRKGR